jgi:uncharacterized damage-inducible protein DinB
MTLREFFLQRHQAEWPLILRVLKALPADHVDYKPHERSPTAAQITWTIAAEFEICLDVVTDFRGEWQDVPLPPFPDMLDRFERAAKALEQRVAEMDEDTWNRHSQFYFGGKMVSEQPAGTFLWFCLFDAIHHRGQLSAYLRPMGGKVPGIYGPSADEPSQPPSS